MSTAAIPKKQTSLFKPVQHFVLYDVEWAEYETFSDTFARRHLRLTYDDGVMEFMTKSGMHANAAWLLGLFVHSLTQVYELSVKSFGDLTCKRKIFRKGAEPDACFYLTNELAVRAKRNITLEKDPPPDLMIEIDITSSSARRLGIYERLRVPEVWVFNGKTLIIKRLDRRGKFKDARTSRFFGTLPVKELVRFYDEALDYDENALLKKVEEWARDWRDTHS